ncbi:MAG TPA: indole-3-glycerol phosphate synthase TrpC [Solirubrobacteraceae bacterium]|nr:indole-3-glycerol phosphate synthase TrpC [Solirubrobacteraceae bacterium]
MNHLERIVADARRELEQRRSRRSEDDLERAGRRRQGHRDFPAAVRAPGLSLIAEHKRRSPSAGAIREDLSLEDVVAAYERGGAAAISVLTDGPNFGGSLDDLVRARAITDLPILRKDFVIDRYQLLEAAAAGADAVLLIVAALSPEELRDLYGEASQLGLDALVEVHDAAELKLALLLDAPVIGINNRNLTTLEVDTGTTYELLRDVDGAAAIVAESGLRDRDQLEQLEAAGVDAVLIGEALMRSGDIEASVAALTAPTM